MVDIQFGPLGGMLVYLLLGLVVIGLLFAPTLGGAIVWGIGALLVVGLLFFGARRVYLVLVGRRSWRRSR